MTARFERAFEGSIPSSATTRSASREELLLIPANRTVRNRYERPLSFRPRLSARTLVCGARKHGAAPWVGTSFRGEAQVDERHHEPRRCLTSTTSQRPNAVLDAVGDLTNLLLVDDKRWRQDQRIAKGANTRFRNNGSPRPAPVDRVHLAQLRSIRPQARRGCEYREPRRRRP